MNVCFWPETDVHEPLTNVCYWGEADVTQTSRNVFCGDCGGGLADHGFGQPLSRRASTPSKGNCCLLRARDERENGLNSAEPRCSNPEIRPHVQSDAPPLQSCKSKFDI